MKNLLVTTAAQSASVNEDVTKDVVLIGGGVMSATLGTYLQALEPGWSISMIERLGSVAEESSNGWNNAGTGHAAFLELNYTPEKADGSIDISKAVNISEAFEVSLQFWAYQVANNVIGDPSTFIHSVPHMSFVWGDENVNFLRRRYKALQHNTLFQGMEYSENPERIKQCIPLVMEGRDTRQKVAMTRMPIGTDVDFGEVTRQLVVGMQKNPHFTLWQEHDVRDIRRNQDGTWSVVTVDLSDGGKERIVRARFVFIGAGGAALPLLQKSGIPEANQYGGFPVGGEFLVTDNPDVVKRHQAKVYGKASVGAPPMSVPHLDSRMLGGKPALLFGPFASFSSKFLKNGSLWDLFSSVNTANVLPMMRVGLDNFDLVKYLVSQVMMSENDRFAELKNYFPDARKEDWRLATAGQRVQVIKKDKQKGGVLKMGTEVVASQDGTIAALLGASPGASTAATIMIELMQVAFKDKMASVEWQARLKEIIPSWGQKLNGNVELTNEIRRYTSSTLKLRYMDVKAESELRSQLEEAPEHEIQVDQIVPVM